MTFDLRRALLKKEETESARLMDFEFRLRARTMRALAKALGLPETELVAATATGDDDSILARLRPEHPEVDRLYVQAQATARAELIAERGDPTPHKLA